MLHYLHTMIRVTDLDRSIRFYTLGLDFEVVSRSDHEDGRFSLVFLKSKSDTGNRAPMIELTHNWDVSSYTLGNAYGHVAFRVDSIEAVQERLKQHGYDLSWGPGLTPNGKTKMAFVDDPDGYEIEILEYR